MNPPPPSSRECPKSIGSPASVPEVWLPVGELLPPAPGELVPSFPPTHIAQRKSPCVALVLDPTAFRRAPGTNRGGSRIRAPCRWHRPRSEYLPPMPMPRMPGGHQPAPMVGSVFATQSTMLSDGFNITSLDLFSEPPPFAATWTLTLSPGTIRVCITAGVLSLVF